MTDVARRRHNVSMAQATRRQVVYEDGRWNGRTVREWLPEVLRPIVERFRPLKVIVFGSLARGDEDVDSDVDLLVVLPHVEDKRATALAIQAAVEAPVPVNVFVTDPDEIARRGHVIGTALEPALREGKVLFERS